MSSESNDQQPPPQQPPKLNIALQTIKSTSHDWSSDEIQSQIPTEILLITANDHEFAACYSYMKNVQRGWHDTLGMVDFGQFDDEKPRVALMKCAQGPAAALLAVKNAAEILYPKVVLFVGICATMKPAKAKLGDVVISAKLATYGDKKDRADGTTEYRGIKANVSRYMEKRILSAADGWEPPLIQDQSSLKVEVHRDAVMLSGPELVDNLERRQELSNHFREALGLEMEGAGLYAAAYSLGIEWAVIKAVSDFGDGSKSVTKDWQPFASVMAASLVHNMFKQAHVIKNWPHYKNIDPGMTGDTIDAKKRKREESSNEDKYKRQKKSQPAPRMCNSCHATDKNQFPDDRNEWPIDKIEISYYEKICELLDLGEGSKQPILSALGCFNQIEVATMNQKFKEKGGTGIAKVALQKWGTADRKNNVGALKKIVENVMKRIDVLVEIENWQQLPVCHGCSIKLK